MAAFVEEIFNAEVICIELDTFDTDEFLSNALKDDGVGKSVEHMMIVLLTVTVSKCEVEIALVNLVLIGFEELTFEVSTVVYDEEETIVVCSEFLLVELLTLSTAEDDVNDLWSLDNDKDAIDSFCTVEVAGEIIVNEDFGNEVVDDNGTEVLTIVVD